MKRILLYSIEPIRFESPKLVDKFTYLWSSVTSTENGNTRLAKTWTDIDRLSVIRKSDLSDKIKHRFFQAVFVSVLLYGYITWTLTKRMERKFDGNCTRMLQAVLKKSWKQHPTKQQLYEHLPPILKTIQTRQARYAGHWWRSKGEFISDLVLWTLSHGRARVRRPARTSIQQLCTDKDVAWKTCRERWTIRTSDGRGSGKPVLAACHDDADAQVRMCVYVDLWSISLTQTLSV